MASRRFRWGDLLALARVLAAHQDEADHRTAVNRAYYAAFGALREWLAHAGPRGHRGHASHDSLWTLVRDMPERRGRCVGDAGDRLRRWRNRVDYDLVLDGAQGAQANAHLAREWARRSLADAATIQAELARLDPGDL